MGFYESLTCYSVWTDKLKGAVGPKHNPTGDHAAIVSYLKYMADRGTNGMHSGFVSIRRLFRYSRDAALLNNLLVLTDIGINTSPGFIIGLDQPKFIEAFSASVDRMAGTTYADRAVALLASWVTLYPTSVRLRAAMMAIQAKSDLRRHPPPMADSRPMEAGNGHRSPQSGQSEEIAARSASVNGEMAKLEAELDAFMRLIDTSYETSAQLERDRKKFLDYAQRMEANIFDGRALESVSRETGERYIEDRKAVRRALRKWSNKFSGGVPLMPEDMASNFPSRPVKAAPAPVERTYFDDILGLGETRRWAGTAG